MRRHDDPTQQAAWERWNDAVFDHVDHRIACLDGCSILGDHCDLGLAYAAREQERWRAYHDVRMVEVTV